MEKEANDVLVLAKQFIQLRNELENLKIQIKNLTKPGFKWVSSMSCRGIPSDAVVSGRNENGEIFCVGRAYHLGDILPAKIACHSTSNEKRKAYVGFQGKEYIKYDFEILCGNNFKWVKAKGGAVPDNSIVAGNILSGEKLYIGRSYYNVDEKEAHIFNIGKLQPSMGVLLILENGEQFYTDEYEVLTELPLPNYV